MKKKVINIERSGKVFNFYISGKDNFLHTKKVVLSEKKLIKLLTSKSKL